MPNEFIIEVRNRIITGKGFKGLTPDDFQKILMNATELFKKVDLKNISKKPRLKYSILDEAKDCHLSVNNNYYIP